MALTTNNKNMTVTLIRPASQCKVTQVRSLKNSSWCGRRMIIQEVNVVDVSKEVWVWQIKQFLAEIEFSRHRDSRVATVCLMYDYLQSTRHIWTELKTFTKVFKSKSHELWHEPELKGLMEKTILEYRWKMCGRPTKQGTACKKLMGFGEKACCIHDDFSAWNFLADVRNTRAATNKELKIDIENSVEHPIVIFDDETDDEPTMMLDDEPDDCPAMMYAYESKYDF